MGSSMSRGAGAPSLVLVMLMAWLSVSQPKSLRASSSSDESSSSTKKSSDSSSSSKKSSSSSSSSSSSKSSVADVEDLPKTKSTFAPLFLQEDVDTRLVELFMLKYGLVGNEDAPAPSKNKYKSSKNSKSSSSSSKTTTSSDSSSSKSSSKSSSSSSSSSKSSKSSSDSSDSSDSSSSKGSSSKSDSSSTKTTTSTRPWDQFGRQRRQLFTPPDFGGDSTTESTSSTTMTNAYAPPSYPPPSDDLYAKYAPPPLPPPEDDDFYSPRDDDGAIITPATSSAVAASPATYHTSTAWIFAKITKGKDCTSTQYMTAGVRQDTCLSMGGVGVVMTCDESSGWVVYHEYETTDCTGDAYKSKYVGSTGCNLPPNGYLSSWWSFEDDKKQKSINIECQPAAPICRNPDCVPSFGKGVYNTWKVYATAGTCTDDDYDLFEAYQVDLCIPSEGYFEKDEASTYFHYSEDYEIMTVSFYENSLKCNGDKSKVVLSPTCASGATTWAYSDEALKRAEQHEILEAIEAEEAKLAKAQAKVDKAQAVLDELHDKQVALSKDETEEGATKAKSETVARRMLYTPHRP